MHVDLFTYIHFSDLPTTVCWRIWVAMETKSGQAFCWIPDPECQLDTQSKSRTKPLLQDEIIKN